MWCQKKKLFITVLSVCTLFLAVAFAIATPAWAQDQEDASVSSTEVDITPILQDLNLQADTRLPIYRLYNSWSGEHLYTTSTTERYSNVKAGWKYEGIEWYAPSTSKTPVYRLYNPFTSDHHYTTTKSEYDSLVKGGWKGEGIVFYSVDATDNTRIPLYRQYNPYATTGTHNYTKDTKEQANLVKAGWKAEGIGWYGYKNSKPDTQAINFSKATVDTTNKTYTAKQIKPAASVSGLTANKDYTVTYGTNKDTGKGTITIKGIGNYTGTKTYNFNIVQKEITAVSGITASEKVYDGKTTATVNTSKAKLTGAIAGDNVTVNATGTFADKNAGNNKTVNVTISGLSGTAAKNYTLKASAKKTTVKANITQRPIIAGNIKATSRVYNGTTNVDLDMSQATLMGVIDGDTVTFQGGSGQFKDKNVGENKIVQITGITVDGKDKANYKFNDNPEAANIKASITPLEATISGLSIAPRDYNQKTDATVNSDEVRIDGILENDEVTFDSATAEYQDTEAVAAKDVGTNKPVKVDVKFAGADKDNYNITLAEDLTGDITAKKIKVDRIGITDKPYDGTDVASTGKSDATFIGVENGDELSVDVTANFEDKNAGENKRVNITINGLLGKDKNNYSLDSTTLVQYANINKIEVSITGISVSGGAGSKIYDGTKTCKLDASGATVVGAISGDKVGASANGEFEDKNVGTNKSVNVKATLTGDDANNYYLPDSATVSTDLKADITPKSVTISGITAKKKTYDGSKDVTLLTDGATITGKVSTDDLTVSASTQLDNKKAGTHTVTFSPVLEGEDKGNYEIATASQTITAEAVVDQVEIPEVTGITSSKDKIYDGTTTAICDASNATFDGKVEGDDIRFDVEGVYNQADAGDSVPMTITIKNLVGDDADNYHLDDSKKTTSGEGIINQRELTISNIQVEKKTYNRSADAVLNYNWVRLGNVVTADKDKITVTAEGKFQKDGTLSQDDYNVADDKWVKIDNIQLVSAVDGDTTVNNYKLAAKGQQTKATGIIEKKDVSITNIKAPQGTRYYDGSTVAMCDTSEVTVDSFEAGDDSISVIAVGSFDNANVGTNKDITINPNTIMLSGVGSGNYHVSENGTQTYLTGEITARDLKITDGIYFNSTYNGQEGHKAYDGKTTAKLGFDKAEIEGVVDGYGVVTGENVSVEATGTFDSKQASNEEKTITISNYKVKITLDDGTVQDAVNYTFNTDLSQESCTGYIDFRETTQVRVKNIKAKTKVYDGSDKVEFEPLEVNTTNIEGLDTDMANFTVKIKGHFAAKDVATPQTVIIEDIEFVGISEDQDDSGVYDIDMDGSDTTTAAIISQKPITAVTGITATPKEYNRTTAAEINTTGAQFEGKVGTDELKLKDGAIGEFDDEHAGKNKTVNVSNMVLDGKDANNYSLVSTKTTTTGTITQKPIKVTGLTPKEKNYDGTASVEFTGEATIAGLCVGDTVTVATAKGEFQDSDELLAKDAGTNKEVKLTEVELDGDAKDDYLLDLDAASDPMYANINKKTVRVTQGINVENKEYNGKVNDPVFNYEDIEFEGLVKGETLSVIATGSYDSKKANDVAPVTLTVTSLVGDESVTKNYTLATAGNQSSAVGVITQRPITITGGVKGVDRVYNGDADVDLEVEDGTQLNNVIDKDDIKLTAIKGEMQAQEGKKAKDAGTNKTVKLTPTTAEFEGDDAENYVVADTGNLESVTINITPLEIEISSSVNFKTKVYNPNDLSVTISDKLADIPLSGTTGGDDVQVAETPSSVIDNDVINPATGKSLIIAGTNQVKITGVTLGGDDADNYTCKETSIATITVKPKEITSLKGITIKDKTYDGTTNATIDASSVAASDDVYDVDKSVISFDYSAKFVDKTAGDSKDVAITLNSISTTSQYQNYVISSKFSATTTAKINKASITVEGITAQSRAYDEDNDTATLDYTGVNLKGKVAGDDVSLDTSNINGVFADNTAAGVDKTVNISGIALSGGDKDNYSLTSDTATTTATLYEGDPTEVAVSGGMSVVSKVYDGTKTATITCESPTFVKTDGSSVDVSDLKVVVVAEFSDAKVGTGKTVTIKSVKFSGADSATYKPADLSNANWQTGLTGDISQRVVNITGITAQDKLRDKTNKAVLNTNNLQISNAVVGEDVQVTSATGVFADAEPGNAKEVTVTCVLGGANAANYTYTVTNPTATIKPSAIIAFSTGEGTAVDQQIIEVGGTATKPETDPTRTGYSFTGWFKEEGCTTPEDFSGTFSVDTIIYAGWAEEMTVTFNTGDGGSEIASQTVAKGSYAKRPNEIPSKDGFNFTNWYKEKTCDTVFDFDSMTIDAPTVIYAGWEAIS